MPLVLKLTKGAVDADLAYFLIKDTTGVYDPFYNPTGYGTVNPERNTLALFVYGYEYQAKVDDLPIKLNNNTPLIIDQWIVPSTVDKYRYFTMLGIPIWTIDPYVFDVANPAIVFYNNKYYKCLADSTNQNPISNPLLWAEIIDLTTPEIFKNTTIFKTTLDLVTNWHGKQCMQTQIFLEAKDCSCDDQNRNETRPYEKIFVDLYAANVKCAQQQYAQADDILVGLAEFCSSLNCEGC